MLTQKKQKYDEACRAIDLYRRKHEGSVDGGKDRASKAYLQLQSEMDNAKNMYILGTRLANNHKAKYFHQDIPALLDSLQDLNEFRIKQLNKLWSSAFSFERRACEQGGMISSHSLEEISRNDPSINSVMFIQHNQSNWKEPQDFLFEPCPIWHDTVGTKKLETMFLQRAIWQQLMLQELSF